MLRVSSILVLAVAVVAYASIAHGQPATFACTVDDTSEVFDGDRTAGHEFRDLDGIQADKAVSIELRLLPGAISLQNVFAGSAQKSFTTFKTLSTLPDRTKTTMVGLAVEPLTGDLRVLVFVQDYTTGKSGFSLTTSRYATPAGRGGETFAFVDITLGHCAPR